MKNIIIGYGETLTKSVDINTGGGAKKHPYTRQEGLQRLKHGLEGIIHEIVSKPEEECAKGEVVVKIIQHPSYLAKSYYPKKFFAKYEMHDLGSKSVYVSPEKWAVKKHPEKALTSCIYLSASKKSYLKFLDALYRGELDTPSLDAIRTFECISIFKPQEKIKYIEQGNNKLNLEVVLHASVKDVSTITAFEKYLKGLGGFTHKEKIKTVGGLSFLPVSLEQGKEAKLADFSHLRVLRSIPKLRINKPDVIRNTLAVSPRLPKFEVLNSDFKVCLFDGGIGKNHLLHDWIEELIPEGVSGSHPDYLSHGGEVCSAYLFGPYDSEKGELEQPYTNVDIVRVVSPEDNDPDLFDVLGRIEAVLKDQKYKYINLSLGPRLPIDDDEVHVWTSLIDNYLQNGSCLATVAIGNDGDLNGENARIQPPSDMVNSLAVGSADSIGERWNRSEYSCIGPGRSPGLVKPDGVIFGGSAEELFPVYSPQINKVIGTMGTSFAAPFALRVAAGVDAITNLQLRASTIKALMIHTAESNQCDMKEVGWGRFLSNPEEVVQCLDDEATIIFQGELKVSESLRIPVPIPNGLNCNWVHLKATFCINCQVDPEHPLHYTRGGVIVTFRPNSSRTKGGKQHAETRSFFSCENLYSSEQSLREDAHKWETTISRGQRFKRATLSHPVFDVKYHAREKGSATLENAEPISYSLVLSIRAEGDSNLYNKVLQENRTLQSIKVLNRLQI